MSPVPFAEGVRLLTIARRYTVATWAFALYEFLITFDKEFEGIWRRRISFATILWFFNRYILHLSLFPTVIAYFLPFTDEQCLRYVKFPGVIQIIINISSGITLSLRIFALYEKSWWTFSVLIPTFLAEIALESWAVAGGVPAVIPKGQGGCILTGSPVQGIRFAALWIGQLCFPTVIFIMMIARAFRMRTLGYMKGGVLQILFRDGLLYFLAIFVVNFANVLTFVLLPEAIKFINAPFSKTITSLMICRIMLNLRVIPQDLSEVELRTLPFAPLCFVTPSEINSYAAITSAGRSTIQGNDRELSFRSSTSSLPGHI